jgi:cytidylate kinase
MVFSKDEIREAKVGEHRFAFAPNQAKVRVRAVRVRSRFVTVEILEGRDKGLEVCLNGSASEFLIRGGYRDCAEVL